MNTKAVSSEKWILAFFGIRGVGSIYYLAFGLTICPSSKASDCGRL